LQVASKCVPWENLERQAKGNEECAREEKEEIISPVSHQMRKK
jgi:hypothetical protein